MKITFLGTGSPMLDPLRQSTAVVVQIGDDQLLFDAGRGAVSQCAKADIAPEKLNAIFITHHHYDHIASLGDMLLTAWHYGRHTTLPVYGPLGTSHIIDALLNQVYSRELTFAQFSNPRKPAIQKVVQVSEVAEGVACQQAEWRVTAAYVDHGNSAGLSRDEWPRLGYRIETAGKSIVISGDTVDCAGLRSLAHGCDALILCCYLAQAEIVTDAFQYLAETIIASADTVGKIAAECNVKHLILTHFRPKSAELMRSIIQDVSQDFKGHITLAEDLMTIEI